MSWEDIIKFKYYPYPEDEDAEFNRVKVKREGNKKGTPKSASVDMPKRKIKDRKDLEKIARELDKAVEMHTSQAKRIREIIGD